MGLRRPGVTKDYEEMPGTNVPMPSKHIHHSHLHNQINSSPHLQRNTHQASDLTVCQDLEMSSVSVVPDGMLFFLSNIFSFFVVVVVVIFNRKFVFFIIHVTDTYTVTQAVNALGFGWFQVKLSLCVGLCWMADSMEMTILSVLGPALHCDWGITRYQQALTTTIVFLGMMMSSTFWGQLSDRCGRKPVSLYDCSL